MGEAKRRGSYEERKALAIARREESFATSRAEMEASGQTVPRRNAVHNGRRLGKTTAIAAMLAMGAMGSEVER